jgi:uncharacterized protein (TIGR03435 family)
MIALSTLCVTHQTASAQSTASTIDGAAANLPAFEVATIKPVDQRAKAPQPAPVEVFPGGRIALWDQSIESLVCIAFNLQFWQLAPGELRTIKETFDIQAKAPENPDPNGWNLRHTLFQIEDEQLRLMLQSLLIQRFHLKFHRGMRTGAVYILELSGKPLKLIPLTTIGDANTGGPGFGSIGWAGRWDITNATMTQFAHFASNFYFKRPVLDQTGLKGAYHYRSKTTQDVGEMQDVDDVASLESFIQEIGLKLRGTTGPVETFVIDHAEPPSLN